ncbi:hypothetical protein [Streptomyces sp. NPDC048481]|uniref:hypothetical protein n=1 Tax=Streptomyces sp. NPDC048481 TaxID=3365557 RepID=UPI003719F10C
MPLESISDPAEIHHDARRRRTVLRQECFAEDILDVVVHPAVRGHDEDTVDHSRLDREPV